MELLCDALRAANWPDAKRHSREQRTLLADPAGRVGAELKRTKSSRHPNGSRFDSHADWRRASRALGAHFNSVDPDSKWCVQRRLVIVFPSIGDAVDCIGLVTTSVFALCVRLPCRSCGEASFPGTVRGPVPQHHLHPRSIQGVCQTRFCFLCSSGRFLMPCSRNAGPRGTIPSKNALDECYGCTDGCGQLLSIAMACPRQTK